MSNEPRSIYYLPGHGGRLGMGLGDAILRRGYKLHGRETIGEFKNIPFSQQIEIIAADLKTHFWHEGSRVIANSFGAYLFLNAQALLNPYVGKRLAAFTHRRRVFKQRKWNGIYPTALWTTGTTWRKRNIPYPSAL